jgi:hypothetical protein
MKFLTLVSSLAAVAYATPAEAEAQDALIPQSNVNGEKILPRFSQSSPKDGATRRTVKYGSYMVSSSKMMTTTKLAKGPCGGTCYVTAMEATIRYPNGKEANTDTGAWLHHIALFGSGAGAGSIWAAGNERPTIRLNTQQKYGLNFPASFMLMIDLMTEDVKPKNLTLEITYETVPKTKAGYAAARMYWLTIGEPSAKRGVFTFNTMAQTANVNGNLLYAIGHMHDGGTHMDLKVSGRVVCKSVMHYGVRAGYSGQKVKRQHAHGSGPGKHISDPGACTDFGSVRTGDRLTATAYYDANQHGLMMHNGKAEKLMGNMRVYIGPSGLAGGLTGGLGKLGGGKSKGLGGLGGGKGLLGGLGGRLSG